MVFYKLYVTYVMVFIARHDDFNTFNAHAMDFLTTVCSKSHCILTNFILHMPCRFFQVCALQVWCSYQLFIQQYDICTFFITRVMVY